MPEVRVTIDEKLDSYLDKIVVISPLLEVWRGGGR